MRDIDWRSVPLLVAGVAIYLFTLGQKPLRAWDEGIYANLARRMVQNGEWLFVQWYPKFFQEPIPFLEKPPLGIWLQALSMDVLGIDVFAARLPSALSAIALGLVVYWIGSERYDRDTGLYAGFAVLTTAYLFSGVDAARQAALDAPFVLFGTLFVYFLWRASDWRGVAVAALAGALAFSTKGLGAGVFLVVAAPLLVRRRRVLLTRGSVAAIAVATLLAAAWPLYAFLEFGDLFVGEFWQTQVVQRVTGTLVVSREGAILEYMQYPYFKHFPLHFSPWSAFLLPAAVLGLRRWRRNGSTQDAYLVWWFASVYLFFAAIRGNHGWYILPAIVPQALLVGAMVRGVARREVPAAIGVGLGFTILAGWRLLEGDLLTPIAVGSALLLILARSGDLAFSLRGWRDGEDATSDSPTRLGSVRSRFDGGVVAASLVVLVIGGALVAGAPAMPSPETESSPGHKPQTAGALAGEYVRLHTAPGETVELYDVRRPLSQVRAFMFTAQRPVELTDDPSGSIVVTTQPKPELFNRSSEVVTFDDGTWTLYVVNTTSAG
jgi:4-amino-4-deoxy-L-arabinose transferase-like glycosyltransferase